MPFAKISGQLERMLGDYSIQLGEKEPKMVLQWRHRFRDVVAPMYRHHVETGSAYIGELMNAAHIMKERIQKVYEKTETPK